MRELGLWGFAKTVVMIAAAGVLCSSCAAPAPMVAMRLDGRSMRDDPVLMQQFTTDTIVCRGETERANMSGAVFATGGFEAAYAEAQRQNSAATVMAGCMAQKGYIYVAAQEAETRAAQLRSTAALAAAQGVTAKK
jgi:hypothetical protein